MNLGGQPNDSSKVQGEISSSSFKREKKQSAGLKKHPQGRNQRGELKSCSLTERIVPLSGGNQKRVKNRLLCCLNQFDSLGLPE